jgi:hypothetical protein
MSRMPQAARAAAAHSAGRLTEELTRMRRYGLLTRIVHRADVITLKGSSDRLRNTEIAILPSAITQTTPH